MSECSNTSSQQFTEVNALNSKLAYDGAAQLQNQSLIDNQVNARALQSLQVRAAEDAQTIKQLATLGLVEAGQTGFTANQQSVSPVRTATGDAIVGGVGVSAEQVAANVADIATALVPVIVSSITQAIASLLPVLVTASGGASTPSQTTPNKV